VPPDCSLDRIAGGTPPTVVDGEAGRFPRRALWALGGLALASLLLTGAIASAGGGTALLAMIRETLVELAKRPLLMTGLFAAWALVSNCLVMPSGSLSMVVGGVLLGTAAPTLIWTAAQVLTAPLLFHLTLSGARGVGTTKFADLAQRYLQRVPRYAATLTKFGQSDGVLATILLRVMPVMPSAPAAMIAASIGVKLRSFLFGSVLAGWIRPLYCASLGAAIGGLTKLDAVSELLSPASLWPLAATFAATLLLVAARIAIRSRA
jgi:uncharacterized membrane protein YdjX (TVP38/TMEM64 family)